MMFDDVGVKSKLTVLVGPVPFIIYIGKLGFCIVRLPAINLLVTGYGFSNLKSDAFGPKSALFRCLGYFFNER